MKEISSLEALATVERARITLLETLDSLGESILYCTHGQLPTILPGLTVEGVGELHFPISEREAFKLKSAAEQAPYGRGEDTLVDTSVRNVWQVEPSALSLHNPEWSSYLGRVVQEIQERFGLTHEVSATLYKLLIYEPGSFFVPHRDTEKEAGMFATLVLCLPSQHEGGKLLVHHDGATEEVSFGGPTSQYNLQYAAFYADCRHEVQPVQSGHRICLIYNLSLQEQKQQPLAPDYQQPVQTVISTLSTLMEGHDKVVLPFKHQYTQGGLHPSKLKGADRAQLVVLARAAEKLNYTLRIALLEIYQSGMVDESTLGYSYYGSRYGRYQRVQNDDDAEFEEIFEQEMHLHHWQDLEGQTLEMGKLSFHEEELLTEEGLNTLARTQHVHEATGNEGVTLDRWYRHAVAVLWPRDAEFRLLAGEGQHVGVPALHAYVEQHPYPQDDPDCIAFAAAVLDKWEPVSRRSYRHDASLSTTMLESLLDIKNKKLLQRFLQDTFPHTCSGAEGPILSKICQNMGWDTFEEHLCLLASSPSREDEKTSLKSIVLLFAGLSEPPQKGKRQHKTTMRVMADTILDTVIRWDKTPKRSYSSEQEQSQVVFVNLFRGLWLIQAKGTLEAFLAHALTHSKIYDLHDVLIPSIRELKPMSQSNPKGVDCFKALVAHCVKALQGLTQTAIPEPTDWKQNVKLDCTCEDCRELQEFILDPVKRVHRFPVRKDRRAHLHQMLDHHNCDMDHVTERQGRPYTLVCTKNRNSYEKACQQWDDNKLYLHGLSSLLQELE